jgi:hypothetical protein
MSPGNPLDHAVQAKPPQVVGHLPWGHVGRGLPQQGSPMVPQIAVGETPRHSPG